MEWNALWGLVYGLLGGFFEFLPVSPQVHQQVFLQLAGLENPGYGLAFAVHFGALVAVIVCFYAQLAKYSREQKLLKRQRRNRPRQPDMVCLMELRLLKTAAVPVVISCLLTPWLSHYFERMWVLAILAVLNGILIFIPQYMSRANKDARSLSPLDATLVGLSGFGGILPGVSRVGAFTSVASMRGADGQFGLRFAYLLTIPGLIALCLGDAGMLLFSGAQASVSFFAGIMACVGAFIAGYGAITIMRLMAQKSNFEGLAYYSWGLAMFTFIVYLIR